MSKKRACELEIINNVFDNPMQDKINKQSDALRVLLVEDEQTQIELVTLNLERASIQVTSTRKPSEAMNLLSKSQFDCVVSDYQMPEMNGIQLCRKIRNTSSIPFIIYTGRGSEEIAAEAFSAGVDFYVLKEQSLGQYQVLIRSIRYAAEKRRAEEDLMASFERVKSLLGALGSSMEELASSEKALRKSNEELSASNEALRSAEEKLKASQAVDHEQANKLGILVQEKTKKLAESEERTRAFMDSTDVGFYIFDSDLRLLDLNRVGLEWVLSTSPFSVRKEDFIGRSISEIFPKLNRTET